nr:MAG TPA: hypothetical protein [Caudoviricetes sp.]
MTNLITLTIPNDDHIALRAFSKALEEMALAHGAPLQLKINEEALSKALAELQQAAPRMMQELRCEGEELQGKRKEPEVDTTAQQVESLLGHVDEQLEVAEQPFQGEVVPTTDSTGTPWDERIHSTSKALNADGTWRLRRKPKDMDEEQWYQLIADVKLELSGEEQYDQEELTRQMDELGVRYDPAHNEGDETAELTIEPPVTPPGDDFHTDIDVVSEQTVAGIPPLPVPPPVVVAPPVTEWDFPRLMTFLTERHGKIDVATVNTVLAQDGMSSVQELNAHPDKIGPFVARVKAYLGE